MIYLPAQAFRRAVKTLFFPSKTRIFFLQVGPESRGRRREAGGKRGIKCIFWARRSRVLARCRSPLFVPSKPRSPGYLDVASKPGFCPSEKGEAGPGPHIGRIAFAARVRIVCYPIGFILLIFAILHIGHFSHC